MPALRVGLLQSAIGTRQSESSIKYHENRSRRAVVGLQKRAIAAAYSPRRYLHIEAVFVFGDWLDHLSAASGRPSGEPAIFTIE
jgi:hypothetical protein